ncbi:MAG: CHASE2 domain-containing protein [Desulfovibrio sp.]|jgi:putative nucleotidyltransferase with HDIG domain|nr:CHASE2 domain-containing protein [Desulfovibrio sp.]
MVDFFRSWTGAAVLSLFFGMVGIFAVQVEMPFLRSPAMMIFDFYQEIVTPQEIPEKIAVVLVGERSLREVGSWPWPRRFHAQLLGKLNLAGLIVIDMLFSEHSTPEDDALLAAVVQQSGKVVLSTQLMPDEQGILSRLVPPFPELAAVAADLGLVNVQPEPDGIYRDSRMLWPLAEYTLPSLPLAVYRQLKKGIPSIIEDGEGYRVDLASGPVRLARDLNFKIHHPKQEIPQYEYIDVLSGQVDPEIFRDAVVIVGVNASGAADFFSIGRGRILPGSVYIAHAVRTLLHGWIPFPASDWALGAAGAVLSILGCILGLERRIPWKPLWLILTPVIWGSLTLWLFLQHRLWLSPLPPLLPWFLAFGVANGLRLRFLSEDWRVQRLSIDSLLFLGRRDFNPATTSFTDYLKNNWTEIEKWSGVSLIAPALPADDPYIQTKLEEQGESGENPLDLQTSLMVSRTGEHCLLLPLPAMASEKQRYTVLGWKGRLSQETVKSVAALVLSSAMHFKALEEYLARRELFLGVLKMIIGAVDAKDPTTAGHSARVAALARKFAKKAGMSEEEAEEIYLGGLLHDVGKIGIPDAILNKPGRLSDEEMEIMRRHPKIGADLMRRIKLPETVIRSIVEHHERLDGEGYPHGLSSDAISLAGRILKIADVYDALLSKRQYKDSMNMEEVLGILRKGIGTDFDADLMEIFLAENPAALLEEYSADSVSSYM